MFCWTAVLKLLKVANETLTNVALEAISRQSLTCDPEPKPSKRITSFFFPLAIMDPLTISLASAEVNLSTVPDSIVKVVPAKIMRLCDIIYGLYAIENGVSRIISESTFSAVIVAGYIIRMYLILFHHGQIISKHLKQQ